ncbi:MAG: GNAT family N-acetyltransferase, partial [Fibrobacterota bacterium]
MVEIKKAQFCDLESILELQKLCYHENAKRYGDIKIQPLTQTLEDIREEFRMGTILKAVDNGTIIGSIRGYVENGTGCIFKVVVAPNHQNRGIGTRLITALEKALG